MLDEIRILIVEDVATDAELICNELADSQLLFTYQRVETREGFVDALRHTPPHIILSDFSLPKFSALEALKVRNELNRDIPFILVTGNQTEEIAVECIKKGADDYILKSSLTRLPSSVLNVLHKKRAELDNVKSIKELKQREEKYRNLFENSLVGMFRASYQTSILIEANDKAKSILGVTSIEGMSLDELKLANDTGTLITQFADGRSSIENFELQIIKSDKSTVFVSISAKLFEREGIIEGVIHDITALKNSYAEMEKANYELDRFAYHASHDLRSPLRSFEGLVLAGLEEDSIDDVRTYLRMMHKSVGKMDALITDLLSIAHNKRSEAKITSINFSLEVDECLSQLGFMENYQAIQVIKNINQEFTFCSDAVRLRIILNNIISNAIKYHRIDQEQPIIQIEIDVHSTKAAIRIKDNGKGIEDRHLKRIFEMFYRATIESEGSGLGLYLVKITIEKLKGDIIVQSEKNAGTIFTIELPNMTTGEQIPEKSLRKSLL